MVAGSRNAAGPQAVAVLHVVASSERSEQSVSGRDSGRALSGGWFRAGRHAVEDKRQRH